MADDGTRDPVLVGRTSVEDRRHPVHVFAGRLTAALEELAGASMLSLGVADATVGDHGAVGCGRAAGGPT